MSAALLTLSFGLAIGLLLGLVGGGGSVLAGRGLGQLFVLLLIGVAAFLVAANASSAV